jgi:hypothetical protein
VCNKLNFGYRTGGGLAGQIRLRLFKIAAQVRVSVHRIRIELYSAYPLKALLLGLMHQRLLHHSPRCVCLADC